MPRKAPPSPKRSGGPSRAWPHRDLYDRVLLALHALPAHFSSSLDVSGVRATDLFSFNAPLGTAIEEQVVESLNVMRTVWDPLSRYQIYKFVRQPQTFPDVRLQTEAPNHPESVLLGVELKGWFALAKEGEPSFRYLVTPDACAPADLLVVVPWLYKNVISGTPTLLQPFIEEARYAAEMRNYHWQYLRGDGAADAGVELAPHRKAYPSKQDKSADKAKSDSGGNFGRVARANIMDDFVKSVMEQRAAGIPVFAWQRFLRAFSETADFNAVDRVIARVEREAAVDSGLSQQDKGRIADYLNAVAKRIREL